MIDFGEYPLRFYDNKCIYFIFSLIKTLMISSWLPDLIVASLYPFPPSKSIYFDSDLLSA